MESPLFGCVASFRETFYCEGGFSSQGLVSFASATTCYDFVDVCSFELVPYLALWRAWSGMENVFAEIPYNPVPHTAAIEARAAEDRAQRMEGVAHLMWGLVITLSAHLLRYLAAVAAYAVKY